MAVAERELKRAEVLTYDDYLKEGETPGRYEIVCGVRQFITSPHAFHQVIAQNIFIAFRTFTTATMAGRAFVTSIDILIGTDPLQVRQPDAMLFSNERWGDRGPKTPIPITAAPELVVEIKSPSNTPRMVMAKMHEYATVGVRECWSVKTEPNRIEVWSLTSGAAPKLESTFVAGDTIRSLIFPGLSVDMSDVFEF